MVHEGQELNRESLEIPRARMAGASNLTCFQNNQMEGPHKGPLPASLCSVFTVGTLLTLGTLPSRVMWHTSLAS